MRLILTLALLAFVTPFPLLAAEDTKEAAAWEAFQDSAAQLTANLPDDEAAGKKELASRLLKQSDELKKFLADFPNSPNRWEARMTIMQIDNSIAMLTNKELDLAMHRKELQSIVDDKDAPQLIRADAELVLLQLASVEFDKDRSEASARKLVEAIEAFLKNHPDDSRAPALRLAQAQALESYDAALARKLYEEATKDPDPTVADAAKSGLETLDFREKPLELEFTALDGSKVNLADLRDKVVLIDFWATWCPPCVEEAPNVVKAYEKFHDKGFEIIGISLDKNKSDLEKFIKEHNMPWPQFFDGKGWENELAQKFNIQSVPTMWLIGRDGKLLDPSPRGRLEQAIEAALTK